MRKIIVTTISALLLVLSTNSSASFWVPTGPGKAPKGFMDIDSLKTIGGLPQMWVKGDFHDGNKEGIKSIKILKQFKCDERMASAASIIVYSEFSGKGNLLGFVEEKIPDWSHVAPDSTDEVYLTAACNPEFLEFLLKEFLDTQSEP